MRRERLLRMNHKMPRWSILKEPPATCSSRAKGAWERPRWPAPRPCPGRSRQAGAAGQHRSGVEPGRGARRLAEQPPHARAGVPGLLALNVDPEAAAREYRERLVGPYRGVLPEAAIASMEEQLSGSCTVEIAAFDEFSRLLGDPSTTAEFDHVLFDTAPTGHTLAALSLPSAWTGFIEANTTGTSCLGPLAGLQAQHELYQATVAALSDGDLTTLILVSRPESSAWPRPPGAAGNWRLWAWAISIWSSTASFMRRQPTTRSPRDGAPMRDALSALPEHSPRFRARSCRWRRTICWGWPPCEFPSDKQIARSQTSRMRTCAAAAVCRRP